MPSKRLVPEQEIAELSDEMIRLLALKDEEIAKLKDEIENLRVSPTAGHPVSCTLTIYRDDSTVQVVYENVKAVFWTAGNTVLVISQYTNIETGAHRYIHWPRERVCWFKDEPGRADPR